MWRGQENSFGNGCANLVSKISFDIWLAGKKTLRMFFSKLAVVTLFSYNVLEAVYATKYPHNFTNHYCH